MDRNAFEAHALPDVCTYTEFRDNMTAHLVRLKKAKRPTLVTRNGRKAAVILSPEAYERLAFGMTIEESRAKIARSIEQMRRGEGIPIDEVVRRLEKRLGRKLNLKSRR